MVSNARDLELTDMQGLLVSAYAHLPCAAFVLLRVTDGRQARVWLASRAESLTTAARKEEGRSTNWALTLEGLAALGIPDNSLATFPLAMHDGGMAASRRSRVLGDAEESAPSLWQWGSETNKVHILLLLYAADDHILQRLLQEHTVAHDSGMVLVKVLRAGRQPDSKEHFGFADGVGQPVVEGSNRKQRQLQRTGHATVIAAGDFVLGYANADGIVPSTPFVTSHEDPNRLLREVLGYDDRHDLGRNGSYLVFRQLAQDVAGFWNSIHAEAKLLWPDDPEAATRLASKMVGRWPSGAPLVVHPQADPFDGETQSVAENNFSYRSTDPHGLGCPIGAHIRRVNPRDSLGDDSASALASSNRHRILRRGRSYGDRALDPFKRDEIDRGLHFMCLTADIERQFEFVQQAWQNNPGFANLVGEVDPVSGTTAVRNNVFTVPREPVRLRVSNLHSFVRVVGGAYFFLPSIRALRFLTSDWTGAV